VDLNLFYVRKSKIPAKIFGSYKKISYTTPQKIPSGYATDER
jgi:hypothetical protein